MFFYRSGVWTTYLFLEISWWSVLWLGRTKIDLHNRTMMLFKKENWVYAVFWKVTWYIKIKFVFLHFVIFYSRLHGVLAIQKEHKSFINVHIKNNTFTIPTHYPKITRSVTNTRNLLMQTLIVILARMFIKINECA